MFFFLLNITYITPQALILLATYNLLESSYLFEYLLDRNQKQVFLYDINKQ